MFRKDCTRVISEVCNHHPAAAGFPWTMTRIFHGSFLLVSMKYTAVKYFTPNQSDPNFPWRFPSWANWEYQSVKYVTFIWRQSETNLFYRTMSYIGQGSKQHTAVTYFTSIQWSKFLVKIMSLLGQWSIQHANSWICSFLLPSSVTVVPPKKYFLFGLVHCKE